MADLVGSGGFGFDADLRRRILAPTKWLCGSEVPRLNYGDARVAGFLARGEAVILTGGCPLTASLDWLVAAVSRTGSRIYNEAEKTSG